MDPNAALEAVRTTLATFHALSKESDDSGVALEHDVVVSMLEDLVEAVKALDGWMTKGGFPPDAWLKSRDAGRRRHTT